MNAHDAENPRLARKENEWVLVLERKLAHPPEKVWDALTQAEQLPAWGPFTTDRDLTSPGTVRLAHIDMPEADEQQGEVLEAAAPRLLVFRWGDDILRWELSGDERGTLLTLRHRFADRRQAPSYAAGWHLCLDGLAGVLNGKPLPSMAGHNAIQYGWQELHAKYEEQFRIADQAAAEDRSE